MMPPLPFDFSIRAMPFQLLAQLSQDSLLAATSLSIDGLVAMSCWMTAASASELLYLSLLLLL